ncbi:MAG TPA: acyl-CoA dehydrogenase [Micromonosporaceae bacterium]|jgi:alkylation response protein AidB-like acyl-CoA dehydrogenase|nr:acyl-CoA dehydrogenase [Micromonosporaceae bacterium]
MPDTSARTVLQGLHPEAIALDAMLGDPNDPDSPYGYAAVVRRDAAEAFPSALADVCGPRLRLSFVPRSAGGELTSLDRTLSLVRVAARRDATIMPATMFSVTAATCVLLAGTPAQRDQVVHLLRSGRAVGFALSEPEHGSDLLANSCELVPAGEGWLLRGRKWLVGLGARAEAMLVVARTGRRGPGAFTAVLIPAALPAGLTRATGMRGIDLAGFRFDDVPVPGDAVVGGVGRGLETAMRAMQMVRTLSTAANLACADTGLRLTLDHAARRISAGRALDEQPGTRQTLGTAAAALYACDLVALGTARGAHTLPGEQSLWSSVAKKVVTDLSAELFDRCADVLGSRSVLRDGPVAAFDVARRDNQAVRYIDTSPTANLRLVAMHLPGWASSELDVLMAPDLDVALTFDAPLPPLELNRFGLAVRGPGTVTASIGVVTSRDIAPGAWPADGMERTDQARVANRVRRALLALHRKVRRHLAAGSGAETDLSGLAESFCHLHAAAMVCHIWRRNNHLGLHGLPAPDVFQSVVELLLARAKGRRSALPADLAAAAFQAASRQHQSGHLFSAVPVPLAESTASQSAAS